MVAKIKLVDLEFSESQQVLIEHHVDKPEGRDFFDDLFFVIDLAI